MPIIQLEYFKVQVKSKPKIYIQTYKFNMKKYTTNSQNSSAGFTKT